MCSEILKFRLCIWITKHDSSSWDRFGLEVEDEVESLFTETFSPSKETYLPISFIFMGKTVVSKSRKKQSYSHCRYRQLCHKRNRNIAQHLAHLSLPCSGRNPQLTARNKYPGTSKCFSLIFKRELAEDQLAKRTLSTADLLGPIQQIPRHQTRHAVLHAAREVSVPSQRNLLRLQHQSSGPSTA